MSSLPHILLVPDPQHREALMQVHKMLAQAESAFSPKVTMSSLSAPVDCNQQRITRVGNPTHGNDLLNNQTLQALLSDGVKLFLRKFRVITKETP